MSTKANASLKATSQASALKLLNYHATEIIPGLWAGDQEDACSYFFLSEKKIQIILNCTTDIGFLPSEINIEKKRFAVEDNQSYQDNQKMYKNLDHIVEYLHKALNQNQNILVHCHNGKQRSPTIIAAYFIRYAQVNSEQAINYLRSKIPGAFYPKPNFDYALEQYNKDMKKKYH